MLAQLNDCMGALLHLGPNVITFRALLHLGPNVITFRTLLHLGQLLHLGLLHRCHLRHWVDWKLQERNPARRQLDYSAVIKDYQLLKHGFYFPG